MQTLLDEPLLTRIVDREHFDCDGGALYIYSGTPEQRSAISDEWAARQRARRVTFVEVTDQSKLEEAEYQIDGLSGTLMLASARQAASLIDTVPGATVYMDITGLSHHVSAPLIRAAATRGGSIQIVYMEPKRYNRSRLPQRGAFYDLSEKTEGIRPLPTFAFLRSEPVEAILVPLLGFEGARLELIVGHVEPAHGATYPIVGVPGFRADYPFVAYWANETALLDDGTYANVMYAVANDPFDLFQSLRQLASDHPGKRIKVAPIGTKPHAIGAILFALSRPELVELIYDHPIRKPERTTGTARLCVYDVGAFLGSELYRWTGDFAAGN